MRAIHVIVLPIFCILLEGCGAALDQWEYTNSFMVSADPLDPNLTSTAALLDPKNNTKNYIGVIVNDSELKCGKFMNGLVLAENGVNTGLDIGTTIFSALATAFSPLATVHALTAGATISSGSKTALDADIYAKATIGNYDQAIQSTYYKSIADYLNTLTNSTQEITLSIEVDKIRTIHKECSLASAQASISSTLQSSPASQSPSTAGQFAISVSGAGTAGDEIDLTATASLVSGLPATAKYRPPARATAAQMTVGLMNAIKGNLALVTAGITVLPGSTATQLVLNGPAGISWSVNVSGKRTETVSIEAVKPPSTQAVVPGSKI